MAKRKPSRPRARFAPLGPPAVVPPAGGSPPGDPPPGDPPGDDPPAGEAPRETPFNIGSIYGFHTRQGLVTVQLGPTQEQILPHQARRYAVIFLEAAEAAESDDALMTWAAETAGLPLEKAAAILHHFREFRKTWRLVEDQDREALRETAVQVLADIERQEADEFVQHFLAETLQLSGAPYEGMLRDYRALRRRIARRAATEEPD